MNWVTELSKATKQVHSQTQEDGIIEAIFQHIGTTNKVCVEFGGGDGFSLSNTRYLIEQGWKGHLWDKTPRGADVLAADITAESVNEVFRQFGVPEEFDFLSLDIDGNDYWVWKALKHRPRVVVIEINGAFDDHRVMLYNPSHSHDLTNYYGASLPAMRSLGVTKGYSLVYQAHSLNAFFIRSDIEPNQAIEVPFTVRHGHAPDIKNRPWVKE